MLWNVSCPRTGTVSCQDPAPAEDRLLVAGGAVPAGVKDVDAALGAAHGDRGIALACAGLPSATRCRSRGSSLPTSFSSPCSQNPQICLALNPPPLFGLWSSLLPLARRVGRGRHRAVYLRVLGAASELGTLSQSLGKC